MKRTVKLILSIALVLLITSNVFPPQVDHSAKQIKKAVTLTAQPCTVYEWYRDEDFTDPIGTTSTIAIEVNRLNTLFPGYVFSSSSGMGLMPFEYGDAYPLPPVIIYSNLW